MMSHNYDDKCGTVVDILKYSVIPMFFIDQWFCPPGMMIESMAGKSAATFAHCYDATPFQFSEEDPAIDHFGELLVKGELLSSLVLYRWVDTYTVHVYNYLSVA